MAKKKAAKKKRKGAARRSTRKRKAADVVGQTLRRIEARLRLIEELLRRRLPEPPAPNPPKRKPRGSVHMI